MTNDERTAAQTRAEELYRLFDWETVGSEYAARMGKINEDLRARPIDACVLECLLALVREDAAATREALLDTLNDFSSIKKSKAESGRSGGKARGRKYAPLRALALELAIAGGYPNAKAAGDAIESNVRALAEELKVDFSADRGSQTIADWLRDAGFDLT
ncbi:hypothetical protein G3O06_19865 [Burkholderia sp. Ac-20345]|uniref:hypothetical protein n=1 Tax=Burkholderia sp. Ac-20345 TaxID=2703891 RepID=UPI00197BAD04|nr:hypothetical protein [Burkholderia sp. Ac-20345]MBN3779797.1 hypothetical protein [Burkholderia sp. Ac-20345]